MYFDTRASPLALKKVRRVCTTKSTCLDNCASPINHEESTQTPSRIPEILSTPQHHPSSDDEHTEHCEHGEHGEHVEHGEHGQHVKCEKYGKTGKHASLTADQ